VARALVEAGAPEAIALAVDIVSQPSHENFETLRVLDDASVPYQPEAAGFLVGEAAVAVRIGRGDGDRLVGPVLGHDLDGDDACDREWRRGGASAGALDGNRRGVPRARRRVRGVSRR